ncbi:substrate-binding periplasmic protein [Kiloniella laminariae]|uniref:substrate-binding periplasmic protein n=1 Tax=Kiloniella laminariae TaxID=454162 RepID=UPI0012FA3AA9|nr:transporter substrate-binding domain-containing protein [Kiloniella laminariae]
MLGKQIPVYLDDLEASVFSKLISRIHEEGGLDLVLSILPAQRASKLFSSGKGDILVPYPLNQQELTPGRELDGDFLASNPLATIDRHVLTLPGRDAITSPEDLKGLRVGVTLGYIYGNLEEIDDIRLISATNQVSLVKMLYSERVDAVVSFPFETKVIAKKLELAPLPWFDPDYVISRSNIVMLFRDTNRGKILQGSVNDTLAILQKSGYLDRISQTFEVEREAEQTFN